MTATGSVSFSSGSSVTATGQIVTLSAGGTINGNATDSANYLANTFIPNIVAGSLVATAGTGIGSTNALVTQVSDLSARNTGDGDIRIYNIGPTNIAGGAGSYAIDTGAGNTGDLTLVSTGPVTQSKALRTDALTVVTVNDPGADITLDDTGNDANSFSIFACLSLPGGCPASAGLSPSIGNGANTDYANGTILYKDVDGVTLTGVGTASTFATFVDGDFLFNPTAPVDVGTFLIEASGDVTLNISALPAFNQINSTGVGSFVVKSGADILFQDTSKSIGTAAAKFHHGIDFTAAGSIVLDNSIHQGSGNLDLRANTVPSFVAGTPAVPVSASATGGVVMQGNHVVRTDGDVFIGGRDFSVLGGTTGGAGQSPGGQELTAAGTIRLLNTGTITVQGGAADSTSASGARISADDVYIGTSDGVSSVADRPDRLLIVAGTNNDLGYSTNTTTDPDIELRQPDATIKATNALTAFLDRDLATTANPIAGLSSPVSLQIVGGTANVSGGSTAVTKYVTAIAGMQAKDVRITTNGSVILQGGAASMGRPNALASASAIILGTNTKVMDIRDPDGATTNGGAHLVLVGGHADVASTLSSISAQNTSAFARIDPSTLVINVDGNVVLKGGISTGPVGSLTSARIDAGGEIVINAGPGFVPFTYNGTAGLQGVVLIGGSGIGIFDSNFVPIPGAAIPITINGTSATFVSDLTLGASVIQTGLATFDSSLLSYIIYAANEETRAARIRRGLGDSGDLSAPACN
jgi:hypothetical protein